MAGLIVLLVAFALQPGELTVGTWLEAGHFFARLFYAIGAGLSAFVLAGLLQAQVPFFAPKR